MKLSEQEVQKRIDEVINFKTQDEHDLIVAEKYGTMPSLFKDRRHLGRKQASLFVFFYYYRRLLFVALILLFYDFSVV